MKETVLMKGNEAIAEAAIGAGCRHYFGYPITPQTEVAAYMAKKMPNRRGCCYGLSERPKRRNSVALDWLFWSMPPHLLKGEKTDMSETIQKVVLLTLFERDPAHPVHICTHPKSWIFPRGAYCPLFI